MKRNLRRVLIMVILFISLSYSLSYADLIDPMNPFIRPSSSIEGETTVNIIPMIIIGLIIVIIIISAIMVLVNSKKDKEEKIKYKKNLMKYIKIGIILVCVIFICNFISNKNIENYNEQFLQYQKNERIYDNYMAVSDLEGLINKAIKNNKRGRKITLIYKNTKYKSVDELNYLLNELDVNKKYAMMTNYDENYYMESIEITSHADVYGIKYRQYEGEKQTGTKVKELIDRIRNIRYEYYYNENININIKYISEVNEVTTINVKEQIQEIGKIKGKIKAGKTYKVEIKCDSDVCDIIITTIN